MPSPVAPVAIKSMPANPAPPANAANAANAQATDANTSTNSTSGDSAKSADFAQMLLLQLGLGEQTPAVPSAPTLAVAASVSNASTDQDSKDDAAIADDPAAALSALLASLGITQNKAPAPIASSGKAAGGDAATAIDASKSPAVAARDSGNSGAVLGATADKQAAKLAAFDESLGKAEIKLDNLPKTAPEVAPPILANVQTAAHTPPANVEAAAHVATPVRDPHWGSEFTQKVVWVAGQDKQSAQLTLNPPQLGPVEVTINVTHDQATAVFSSPHSEVRQAIETAMPQLREAFAAAGIQLGQASVNSESFRQQQGNEPRPGGQTRDKNEGGILADDGGGDSVVTTTSVRQGLGLVNTFA